MKPDRFCKNCGKKMEGKWQISFCSRSCSASYNNVERVNLTGRRICKVCGGVKHTPHANMCLTCSRNKSKKTLETVKVPVTRKKLLLIERGHKCESCGLETWLEKPIKLELHHVDGNSDNNDRSNLQLLCPNCYALTPTYRAANIGNGSTRSTYRKKYYHRE